MTQELPSKWASPRLEDICEINPRSKPDISFEEKVTFVPMEAIDERFGEIVGGVDRLHREVARGYTPFREGDVLFAKITPCMENGKAAVACGLKNGFGFGSTEFHVLRPKPVVSAQYLFCLVRSQDFRARAAASFQGAVGQQRVPQSFLAGFRIPLPPLSEQQQIVEILQEAEQVHRLHAAAEAKIADLIPYIFRSMFLLLQERDGWPVVSVEQIAAKSEDSIRTGPFGSDLLHSEFVDEGIPVLGIDNAVQNRFRWGERRFITPSKYAGLRRFRVFPEDVMVTIMGTVGRAAMTPPNLPESISTKHLCVVTVDRSKILPVFLWATLLYDPFVRAQARSAGKGAIMEGWNSSIVRSLRFHLPPMDAQKEFNRVASAAMAVEDVAESTKKKASAITASLLVNAFAGELTAEWRGRHETLLAQEAAARDEALKSSAVSLPRPSLIEEIEEMLAPRTEGAYAELTREQRVVLEAVERGYGGVDYPRWFTAEDVAKSKLSGALRGNPQAIESHLSVLTARGLVIAVSREEENEETGEIAYGNAYRLPLRGFEPREGEEREPVEGDDSRLREMQRLVARLEKERLE